MGHTWNLVGRSSVNCEYCKLLQYVGQLSLEQRAQPTAMNLLHLVGKLSRLVTKSVLHWKFTSLCILQSLTGELMEYWPNCYIHTPFWSFWWESCVSLNIRLGLIYREHEYLKHGTCCEGISSMSTEYGFFLTTLNLYKKHQINGWESTTNWSNSIHSFVQSFGIWQHPSIKHHNIYGKISVNDIYINLNLTQVSKIMDTIHSATGHVPLLYCYNYKTKVQILQQIVLCMNKQFDLIDCPEEPHAYCHKDEPVLYPQRPSTSWWCCRVVQWLQHIEYL